MEQGFTGPALPPPGLEHFCDLSVEVGLPVEIGDTPQGRRRLIPIVGGTLVGAGLRGEVLPGGADVQWVVGGTTALLDARYAVALSDGAHLYIHNRALRVASPEVTAALLRGETVPREAVYFRCQPRIESGDSRWAWLMQHQFVGSGERLPAQVRMSFYRVL